MTTRQLSIAAALNELKLTRARIERAIDQPFIFAGQSSRNLPLNFSREEFEARLKSNFESVTALLRNYENLKSGIAESNAATKIRVGTEEMTVAAAIERKTSIQLSKDLLAALSKQSSQAQAIVQQGNDRLQLQAEDHAQKFFDGKVDRISKDFAELVAQYLELNQVVLIDPLKLDTQITKLRTKIEDFLANVDLALTSSNVTTLIEIPV